MQPTDLAMALTHGQMAKALRLGEVTVLDEDRGTDGRPTVETDPARARVRRLGATITAGMLVAGALTTARATENPHETRESGRSVASGMADRGSIPRPAAAAPGRDRAHASADRAIQAAAPSQEQTKMLSKFTGVAAATAVGVSATVAGAQSAAVQWRVEDGGNGHWYEIGPSTQLHNDAVAWAVARGSQLTALETQAEQAWALSLGGFPSGNQGAWIGMIETVSGWQWNTGVFVEGNTWLPGNPCGPCDEPVGVLFKDSMWGTGLADSTLVHCCAPYSRPIVEWSADCNNDGIVDYGQILDGTFTDANSNGIPDSCDCLGDIDDDGWIDGVDLGGVLAAWGKAPAGTPADLNADGAVDGTDLGVLLAGWGACAP